MITAQTAQTPGTTEDDNQTWTTPQADNFETSMEVTAYSWRR